MPPPDATQHSAGGMTDPNADLDALPVLAARIARYRALRPPARKGLLGRLGPGLITGASDDDPSGIATYSQTGAQFGYAMCWVMLFCFPLMVAIQEISARAASPMICAILAATIPPGPAFIAAPYCAACSAMGMLHCSDPINCGGSPPMRGYIWSPATESTMAGWVRPNGGPLP